MQPILCWAAAVRISVVTAGDRHERLDVLVLLRGFLLSLEEHSLCVTLAEQMPDPSDAYTIVRTRKVACSINLIEGI